MAIPWAKFLGVAGVRWQFDSGEGPQIKKTAADTIEIRNAADTGAATLNNWRQVFANAAARTADATTYDVTEKFVAKAIQTDDGSIYYLSDHLAPTWTLFKTTATTTGMDICITRLISANSTVPAGQTCLGRDTVIADGIELTVADTGEFLIL